MSLRRPFIWLALVLTPVTLVEGQQQGKAPWQPSPHIAASEALRPEQQLKKFRLPAGFEIQLVASDPDIRKPINIAFDAAGRLWVTETIEYPFPAAPGKGRDAVKVLGDFGPDGKARKITTFADGLNIPIGVLPLTTRQALVYSIPSLSLMTAAKSDAKAEQRQVLFSGYGFQDTHGMTGEFVWGFDGWIYACHGYSNTSKVKDADGKPTITMQSGNTYRFQRDGSKIEYFTHGQVNPFGLSFDPLGNLYSADCHTQPIYQLLRGAYYPSFGKPHDGMGFGPETITRYDESTAIGGIAYYAADQYPEAYRGCVFIGDVVTNRVNMFRLSWHGSTPSAKLERFLQSDDPWFRPVDVKLGPDGCLYVADFYNRIIGHYEVPLDHPGRDRDKGRIWRIVYRGPDGKGQPQPWHDLTKVSGSELVRELDNPNLAVRLQATHQLVLRNDAMETALVQIAVKSGSAWQKAHGLWVLERLGCLEGQMLAMTCKDNNALVRVHAKRILTDRGRLDPAEYELVLSGLQDADALVQRCAAEALGMHQRAENIQPLLEAEHRIDVRDTHLRHAVRMALRDQLRLAAVWQQLDPPKLSEKDQAAIADVCPGVHAEQAGNFLEGYLKRFQASRDDAQRYIHTIVRYAEPTAAVEVVSFITARFPGDLGAQAAMLKTVQQANQERGQPPNAAATQLASNLTSKLLGSTASKDLQSAIDLAGAFKLKEAQPQLLALARSGKAPERLRNDAVAVAVALEPSATVKTLGELLLNDTENITVREQVATALAGTNRAEAHAVLLKTMETAPARLQTVIALGLADSKQGGEKLVESIAQGKASVRLLQERTVLLKLRQAKVNNLDGRLAKLTQGLPAVDQRIAELMAKHRAGFLTNKADATAGAKVFEKHCAICHQLANRGAKVGPQLNGIGMRGLDRILEDVLDPNRNVDQAFRSTTLLLKSGQTMSGLVLREEGEVIVLADAQGKEQRVPKVSVDERIVSQLSPMPSNFAEQIVEADLYDLVAYLLAQTAKE